ncbi:MAG: GHKL domain-containing protein [Epsilonproteobacteria bacterium]|nr:GHKL domain-containing protein [Campylobacterota bacterium]
MMKKDIVKVLLVAIFYFLSGKISFYLSMENSIVTISIFFAEGVALASVLLFGKKVLPGVFLGQLILAISSDLNTTASILISIVNTAEAFIALRLLTALKFDIKFNKIRDLYILFLVIMFVLQPFSALFGNLVLLSSSVIEPIEFFKSFFSWWFGNVMGQFLVTPMLILLYINYKSVNILKFLLYGLFFAVFNYTLIGIFMIDNLALLLSIMVPVIMLHSRYNGLCYTLFAILMIALTSLYTTTIGLGIFANSAPIDNIININFYILAHILISLINGVMFLEKEDAVKDLLYLNNHLSNLVKDEVEKNRQKESILLQQSRLAKMGEMISMIAHQWRQPLNNISIINQTLLLKYKRGSLDDKVIENFKKDSNSQIKQMSNTIDDFRNFFKPNKEKDRFCISSVLEHTLNIVNPMLKDLDINIQINAQKDIFIKAYKNEFGHVLLNIINNAKDALNEQNIQKKVIYINLKELEDSIILSIEDNAGGIDKEIIEDVFNPYFSTKEAKNGTGLGLYMSKLIIEEHMGGTLIASNTDKGALFSIVLNKE